MDAQAAGMYAVSLTFGNAQSSLGEALGITSFAIISNEKSFDSRKTFLTETFRHSALVSVGLGLALSCLIPLLVKPLFGSGFSAAIRPAMILAIAAALTTSSDILNEGLRGAGRPYAGLVSQLVGTAVLALAASLLLRKFGLVGMAWAVLVGACAQVGILVAAAANWLQVSPSRFWPFGIQDIKTVSRQMAALRLRYSRSPA
jgi:O-antigen/teichoic acid export membrane protein